MPAARFTLAPSASGTPSPPGNVQARTERILLVVTGIAVLAFAVSFVLGVSLRNTSDPTAPEAIAADDFLNRGRATRVEVLNGAGRSGLAREVTGQLRESGYD